MCFHLKEWHISCVYNNRNNQYRNTMAYIIKKKDFGAYYHEKNGRGSFLICIADDIKAYKRLGSAQKKKAILERICKTELEVIKV